MINSWVVPERVKGFERLPGRVHLGVTLYAFRKSNLTVLLSVDDYEAVEPGAGVWVHASLARPDRDPTWGEVRLVRDAFFGPNALVAQVLAPAAQWINVHSHCLHLWMRIDALTFPAALYDQLGADGKSYTTHPAGKSK